MTEQLFLGRSYINEALEFLGEVTGGGSHGPGRVSEVTGFAGRMQIRWAEDYRSGSKRSGRVMWELQADRLYVLEDVANGSRSSGTYYVSTIGGVATELTRAEFKVELETRYPAGKLEAEEKAKLAAQAEEARARKAAEELVERQKQAALREQETEALREINAEKAAEIAANGQEKVGDLPSLTGTPKQIAYALSIREAYAVKNPGDAALKRGTTAKYWIENHRSILFIR